MTATTGDIVLYALDDGTSPGELRPGIVIAERGGYCNLLVLTDRANDGHPPILWRDQVQEGTAPGTFRTRDNHYLTAGDARELMGRFLVGPADPTVTEIPQAAADVALPAPTAPEAPAAPYLTQTTDDDLHHNPAY